MISKNRLESIIIKFLSAWLIASMYIACMYPSTFLSLSVVGEINPIVFGLIMLGAAGLLFLLEWLHKDCWIGIKFFLFLVIAYAAMIVYMNNSLYIAIGVSVLVILTFRYFINKYEEDFSKIKIGKKTAISILIIFIILWLVFVIGLTVLRYIVFRTPCFDFGIFSQMFYYMKEYFTPMTTCERGELLSHFKVHMSPSFYLLLPIYLIFPYQITLIVIQAVFLVSGVIPIYLLCKQKKFSIGIILAIMLVYILFPATAGGCFYDFHENKLLLPIILWLFYFIEKKKNVGIIILTILTLLVKEDAAIYVACIGLYLILRKKEIKKGIIMFVVSVIYFFGVIYYLENFGDGAMLGRYANYMTNNGGLLDMIGTIIKNPAYLVTQVFTKEKMEFLVWMFVPIMGIIFKTKRYADYILIIPLLVINLMSNNPYQHSIYYQYTYGVTAILFYLVIENVEQLIENRRNIVTTKKQLVYMCIASALLFISALSGKLYYLDEYNANKDDFKLMREILDEIPEEASVEASTFLVSYLSQRNVIYRMGDTEIECDYIIFDLRYKEEQEKYAEQKVSIEFLNYSEIINYDNLIAVFYKRDA